MASTLKDFFSRDLVARLAADLARAHPRFPVRAFVEQASSGLERLELLVDVAVHFVKARAAGGGRYGTISRLCA